MRDLRGLAEGCGEFGKYQEQDKDRIESYTKKEILETALGIRERCCGHDNVEIANTLYNLGNTYHASKDYQKAKESFKKALAIEEKHYGLDHSAVAKTSVRLKETLRALFEQ